jgi:hypothetical protein
MARTPEIPAPGAAIYAETAKALKGLAAATAQKKPSRGKESLSDADAAKLRKFARRHKQNTDCLSRISHGASKAQFKYTFTRYLEAFSTRVCATVRAFAKTRRQGSLRDIYEFAEDLDVWKPLSERVRVRTYPKSKGGYRTITRSGCRRMAQQFIVRDLLTALGIDSPYDYSRRGAGGEKAMIGDVCQRIQHGYKHWQTVDIKECFASLRPAHFGSLPIPKKLIRNVVFLPKCAKIGIDARSIRLALGDACTVPTGNIPGGMEVLKSITRKVRRELPQGSVLSPLVARAFVGRELRAALGNEVARFSFIDDLTLGARSQPKVEEGLNALRGRLLGNPAGPVLLHVNPPTSTQEGRVRVFGYVLKPGRGYGGNSVHVHPDLERFDRFHKKLYERWKAADKPMDLEGFTLDRLARWMPTQQAWTVVPVWSKNLALSHAFIYICEEDLKEFRAQAQKGARSGLGCHTSAISDIAP